MSRPVFGAIPLNATSAILLGSVAVALGAILGRPTPTLLLHPAWARRCATHPSARPPD
ncbi:MAG TPA: hypothetical protein VFO73_10485 [Candidatus Limnocylindrales bacterium]|nr:hypothetical protein [Candidatus Limnocylindrales bacterium]